MIFTNLKKSSEKLSDLPGATELVSGDIRI